MTRTAKGLTGRLLWGLCLVVCVTLLAFRLTDNYSPESQLGIDLGLAACLFIALSAATAWWLKRSGRAMSLVRQIHYQLGLLALFITFAHWHFLGRDYIGISAGIILILLSVGLAFQALQREYRLRAIHKYAGYTLVLLVIIHGVRALFFSGN